MKTIKDDYFVSMPVDELNKRFTVTCRSEYSHNLKQGSLKIDQLTGRTICHWGHWKNGISHPLGNDWPVQGRNLAKKDGRYFKENLIRTMESLGYTYHPVFDEGV
jgi:hypothetical protein